MNDGRNKMDYKEFETIAPRLRSLSMQTSRMMGVNDDDADDIAQDVLLKIWMMRSDLRRFHSIEALTVVATKHVAIDMYRRRKNSLPITDDIDSILVDNNTPLRQIISDETIKWIEQRARALPDKEHTVLRLRQVEKREYSEIARLMGIEEASARVILSRARKHLLQQFNNYLK